MKVAERMGVAPWVLDPDERIMPWEWAARTLMVMNVEAEATEYRRKEDERKRRMRPKGRR